MSLILLGDFEGILIKKFIKLCFLGFLQEKYSFFSLKKPPQKKLKKKKIFILKKKKKFNFVFLQEKSNKKFKL